MRTALPTRALALPTTLVIVFFSLALPAGADVGEKIILRCTHNQSLSGFTQKDYEKALKELETSSEEYTDCANLIHRAELAAAGARRGGPGAGGGFSTPAGPTTPTAPATPAEQRDLNRAAHSGSTPQRLGNQLIRPGVVPVDISSALSSLPNSLLVILAFLLACALALVGGTLTNRVRERQES